MTTTAPPADSRLIALAHYAARGVLESVLGRHGLTFQQSVTLRPVALSDAPVSREALVAEVCHALKADPDDIHGVVDELIGKGLVVDERDGLRVSPAGRELYGRVTAETAEKSARVYAGIPAEDLAVAGRVLARITERANAELAAPTA